LVIIRLYFKAQLPCQIRHFLSEQILDSVLGSLVTYSAYVNLMC